MFAFWETESIPNLKHSLCKSCSAEEQAKKAAARRIFRDRASLFFLDIQNLTSLFLSKKISSKR